MKPIICPNCGESNSPNAERCHSCGTPLYSETFGADRSTDLDAIDGISGGDMATFIGKKACRIMPYFYKISADKTGWCWPAAVWGILIGPAGVAIWLFWRKMRKQAWAFLGLALLLTAVPLFCFAGTVKDHPADVYHEQYNAVLQDAQKDGRQIEEAELQATAVSDTVGFYLEKYIAFQNRYGLGLIQRAINVLCGIVGGFFGYVWYKNFAVKRIKKFRSRNSDPRYYSLGLMRQGSTSCGLAVLGYFVLSVCNTFLILAAYWLLVK